MYLNPRSTEICLESLTLTPRHAAGIRRALEADARKRAATYVKAPLARRFQTRVKQVDRHLQATIGPYLCAPLGSGKRFASWVWVEPMHEARYSLTKLHLRKTRYGVVPSSSSLPVALTAHCFDRLIQQAGLQQLVIPRLMFDLLLTAQRSLHGSRTTDEASSVWPVAGDASLATCDGLFICAIPKEGPMVVKTYIAVDRLMEKRALWESMMASETNIKFFEYRKEYQSALLA